LLIASTQNQRGIQELIGHATMSGIPMVGCAASRH